MIRLECHSGRLGGTPSVPFKLLLGAGARKPDQQQKGFFRPDVSRMFPAGLALPEVQPGCRAH